MITLSVEDIEKRIADSYELSNNVLQKIPEPLVSVRTSTYNHGKYIKYCIEGVLMQKTTFPFEFIIGEDCSTDETREIVFEYAKKYPDIIRVITADYNVGSKANGRRCIRACRGKYMAICEGDDYWIDPYKLQKQVDFLERHPDYSMCFHNAVVFNDKYNGRLRIFNNLSCSQEVSLEMIITDWIIPTASIVFINNCYQQPAWASEIYSGDMLLALMCYSVGKIYYVNEVMSFYRQNLEGGSMSAQLIDKPLFVLEQQIKLYDYYNKATNRKYESVLKAKIRELKSVKKFVQLRQKSLFLAVLFNPIYVFKQLRNRMWLSNSK